MQTRKFLFIGVWLLFLQSIDAQNNTLTLKIPSTKKIDMPYSLCIQQITDCIDTLYKCDDTLFIILQDTREFYGDGQRVVAYIDPIPPIFEARGKLEIKIPIQDDFNCDFIVLKTFDLVCGFSKVEKKDRVYKLSSVTEVIDYSNKKIKDIKDSDIKIRY